MDISLAQLRCLVAVADERHFGRAADRLQMTQPPLTRQIQSLERAVGVRLVDRGGRAVTMTPAGQELLASARQVLGLVAAAPGAARRVADGETGTLRLAFTAVATYAVLDDVLTAIGATSADLRIELAELVSEDQFVALDRFELDLALARPPVPTHLASRHLHTEDLVAAIPADHPLAQTDGPVRLAELDGSYIGYRRDGSSYLHDVCAALVGMDQRLAPDLVSQIPTMLGLVRAGRGFALVPRSATAMQVQDVRFRELDAAEARQVHLYACWHPDNPNPALARVLGGLETLGAAQR